VAATGADVLHAFTLIELLTVIGIIALLAALLIASLGVASRSSKEKRVRAELEHLVTAIEAYKAKLGFYPPGNSLEPDRPPLFYELSGTTNNSVGFGTLDGAALIDTLAIASAFNRASPLEQGFANSVRNAKDGRNFLPDLKSSQYSTDPKATGPEAVAYYLIVPFGGTDPVYPKFNPWRYVVSSPTNNPRTFDLWAEVVIGGQTKIIGNWKN
jgi:prepilin-type N-terminal cleavage/methylation domain-containing protein